MRQERYSGRMRPENAHGRHESPERKSEPRGRSPLSYELTYQESDGRSESVRRIQEIKAAPKNKGNTAEVGRILRNVLLTILIVAAVSVLLASFKMPVIRVYGDSMVPLVSAGDTVIGIRDGTVEQGDIVGVYYGNKLLTKRCIAVAGQTVDLDEAGNVYVDGTAIAEPYAFFKESLAETADIELPYTVPQESIFVLGDNRRNPADSRSEDVGCFRQEDVCGRLVFRIWPLPMKVLK